MTIYDEYPDPNMEGMAAMNRRNEILMTLDGLLNLREKDETNIRLSATYYLKNPDRLGEFETFARANGLSELFDVTTDEASYDMVVKPVQGMQSFSITFMIIVLVLGAIILVLLTSIAIRERKYEIGVLRAMGMKKRKVSLGLWTELLVITCVCLVLGVSAGALTAQPVANMLIEQQAEAFAQNNPGMMPGGPGGQNVIRTAGGGMNIMGGGSSNVKPADSMEVMVSGVTILEITGIALLLATLAGLLSLTRITKYEPIKILMERN